MSCNGCRVLRKRCSDNCTLRSCLQWIDGAEAQGHATAFVAKYFGRAGLTNFIASVPPPQRPALFRSLFYEACGRIVNPVHGAVGLLCSGDWQVCQDAAEMVLNGKTLQPLSRSPSQTSDPSATHPNQRFSTLPLLEHASAETVLLDQANDVHTEHTSFAIAPPLGRMNGLNCRERFHESESIAMKADLQPERNNELRHLPTKLSLKRKLPQHGEAAERSQAAAGEEAFCEGLYRNGVDGEAAAESAVVLDLTLSSHPLAHPKRRHKAACTKMQAPAAPGCNSVSSEGSVTSLDHTPGFSISPAASFLPLINPSGSWRESF